MSKRWFLVALVMMFVFGTTLVSAQDSSGTLVLGQPSSAQITTAGQTLRFDYTLAETSQVSLQALSDSVPLKITIVQGDAVVAAEPNPSNALTVSLDTVLAAGAYVVEVGATNDATGLVILALQSETPLTITALGLGQRVAGTLDAATPLLLYRFDALSEPGFLYVDTGASDHGVSLRLVNTATGQVSAQASPDLLGVRWRIPTGAAYRVEVGGDDLSQNVQFSVCVTPISAGGCEGGDVSAQLPATAAPVATVVSSTCTVTPNVAGGVNIRQSATTNSSIIGKLPGNASADVVGVAPDRSFYNIRYNGIDGWVAQFVVIASGDCGSVGVVNPPPIPTQPPLPTQVAAPTMSGPCLIVLTAPTYVYTTTTATMENLFDQVQGGQLIPIGRLADNSWWQTNDYGAWIPTSAFGDTVQISGNCDNLPIVSP